MVSKKGVIQPEGNFFDKYNSSNILVRKIMKGFFRAYDELIGECSYRGGVTILEAGCGEGEVTNFLYKKMKGAKIDAFDVSDKVIELAKERFKDSKINFQVGSIYNIVVKEKYDLVVCSEVLEHLEEPEKALEQIKNAASEYLILSVPREPIWCVLNMVRGKYLKNLGNTPGHINHWSRKKFLSFLKRNECNIIAVKNPLPWTVVLIKL